MAWYLVKHRDNFNFTLDGEFSGVRDKDKRNSSRSREKQKCLKKQKLWDNFIFI
jgi:hypothetical protein